MELMAGHHDLSSRRPDIISTDIHYGSNRGPCYDLPTAMTKMLMVAAPARAIAAPTQPCPRRALLILNSLAGDHPAVDSPFGPPGRTRGLTGAHPAGRDAAGRGQRVGSSRCCLQNNPLANRYQVRSIEHHNSTDPARCWASTHGLWPRRRPASSAHGTGGRSSRRRGACAC